MLMMLEIWAAMIVSLFVALNNHQFASVSGALRSRYSEQQHPEKEGIRTRKYGDDGEIAQDVKLLSRQLAMRAGRHTASGINGTTTTLRNLSVVDVKRRKVYIAKIFPGQCS